MYQTFVNLILKYEATAYAAKHNTGRFVDSFIFYIRIIYIIIIYIYIYI